MKRFINLLPTEQQRVITLERLTSRLVHFFVVVIVSLAALSVIFFFGRLWLQSRLVSLRSEIANQQGLVSREENKKFKQQLDELNTHVHNLTQLQQRHVLWSEVLVALARLVPKDLAIDRVSMARETGRVSISGFARSRESILALRTQLLDSKVFTDVDFPLSNITKPKDADFHYSFSVDWKAFIEK